MAASPTNTGPLITEAELILRLSVNIRRLRAGAGLSQHKLAEQSGLYWRHMQRVEAGEVNVTVQTIARLAAALRVDPAVLLTLPPADANQPSTPEPPVEPAEPDDALMGM